MKKSQRAVLAAVTAAFGLSIFTSQAFAASSGALDILRQGLLGAGTGAIAAGASGGKAGRGALIGAGTNVIGGALLGFLTGPSASTEQPVYSQPYYASSPQPTQQIQYAQPQPVVYQQPEPIVYPQPSPVYAAVPQEDPNKKIIKQGILGAGVGAISASASGGKTGQGALIGAGTNIIGGALLDTLMAPSASQAPVYSAPLSGAYSGQTGTKHILRKYDESGHVISEEEFWV